MYINYSESYLTKSLYKLKIPRGKKNRRKSKGRATLDGFHLIYVLVYCLRRRDLCIGKELERAFYA